MRDSAYIINSYRYKGAALTSPPRKRRHNQFLSVQDRRYYTAEEKVKILREVLEDGMGVSAVAETHGLSPNNIFNWRKQLFEGAVGIFQLKRADISGKAEERRVAELESKLSTKAEGKSRTSEPENPALKKRILAGCRDGEDKPALRMQPP
jgi:transposase-like protein